MSRHRKTAPENVTKLVSYRYFKGNEVHKFYKVEQ
jgi:hypothetical protein